jgi:hypothetical protein
LVGVSPVDEAVPVAYTAMPSSNVEKGDVSEEQSAVPQLEKLHADSSTLPDPTLRPYLPNKKLHSRTQAIALIAIVTCTMSMSAAAGTSLNIALPTIQIDLGIPEASLQWLMSAFTLTSACFMLLSGRVADIYGRKTCSLFGMAWFGAFTVGAGFARSGTTLIVLRALSGIGAAIG